MASLRGCIPRAARLRGKLGASLHACGRSIDPGQWGRTHIVKLLLVLALALFLDGLALGKTQ